MALYCRAIALGLSVVWLAATPAAACSLVVEPTAATPAVEAAPIPAAVDDLEYDPLFEDFLEEASPANDPFEGTNRAFLKFNRGFDRFLLSPMTRGYRFVVPEPARKGLRRVFINLNSPSILVNDLLQLRFKDAGQTFGRFLLNTTLGVGGLMDVGVAAGWEHHDADFGQTLAKLGVGPGPYLMLPILGPNTLRDGLGDIVDVAFQPLTYLIGPTPNIAIGTGSGFTTLEAMSPAMKALEESSVDYYAALRSAYLQNRDAQIWQEAGGWD
jgi:phospholipid-binding lipoprotein MlaA